MRPVPGNHEYGDEGRGYFAYFGERAGRPDEGYYSYELGAWHVVALNTSDGCAEVSCAVGSDQERWLRRDLADVPRGRCVLAYWHHPLFSSATFDCARLPAVRPLWQALQDNGADVAVVGHSHSYERFAPQTAIGAPTARGIRQFVVGTGGEDHHQLGTPRRNSQARSDDTFGILALSLRPGGYDWRFVGVSGSRFTDLGSGTCG